MSTPAEWYRQPLPRQAKAMRLFLGWSVPDAARLSRLSPSAVREFETPHNGVSDGWRWQAERLHEAYAGAGAAWSDKDFDDGAHMVWLRTGSADDRRAIRAALALMGWYEVRNDPKRRKAVQPMRRVSITDLARRVQRRIGPAGPHFQNVFAGSGPIPPDMLAACLLELTGTPDGRGMGHEWGAGCYFARCESGAGWRAVGCSHKGWLR